MDIGSRVIRVVEQITDLSGISANSDLEALGCDSLDLIEIVIAIEDEFHVEITDAEGESIATVQDIINLISAKGVGCDH